MAFGNRRQDAAKAVHQFLGDARRHVAARCFGIGRLVETSPATAKPIGIIGLIGLASLKLLLENLGKAHGMFGGPIGVDHAFLHQTLRVDFAHARLALDHLVHQRLGEAGFVAFIVAKAAIAPHVDHDVAVEALAELDCHLAGKGHRFGIVAIDVEDRCLDALRHIARIGRGACKLRAGGETDLVVDDEVDAAASIVTADTRKAEAFPYNALAGKGGIAMEQHRKYLFVLTKIVADRLVRADLAEHHRVHRLEVRGVGNQRHVDLHAVKLAVG